MNTRANENYQLSVETLLINVDHYSLSSLGDFTLLYPVVYSTDRSKAVVLVLVLLFGALCFILRGDLLYVLPCAIFFLCFSVV